MNFVSLLLLCSLVAVGLTAVIEKKAEKDKLLESATVPSLSSPLPRGSSRNSTTSLPKRKCRKVYKVPCRVDEECKKRGGGPECVKPKCCSRLRFP